MLELIRKIKSLFDQKQRKKLVLIQVAMIFGAFLEILSISLIVPIFLMILNNDSVTPDFKLTFLNKIGTTGLLLALIFAFFAKNLFLSFQSWVQSRFTANNRKAVKKRLLQSFFNRSYEEILCTGTSEILKRVNSDVDGAFSLISSYLNLCTEIIVSLAVFCTLLLIDVKMTVSISVLLIIELLIISSVIDPISRKSSQVYRKNNSAANSYVIQAFRGIKEIKVAKTEDYFLNKFDEHTSAAIEAEVKSSFISLLPRNIIESITISGMMVYVLLVYLFGHNVIDLVPKLSAFGVAAVRLIPSFNRITTKKNVIAYNESRLDSLIDSLSTSDECVASKDSDSAVSHAKNLGIKDLSFSYKGREKKVLCKANLDIPVGSFVGIVGESGSGKTTTVDLILGLLKPQKGYVYSDDEGISDRCSSWLDHIGYIPQEIYIFNASIRQNIAFGVQDDKIDDARVAEVLKMASLWDFVESLPQGVNTVLGENGAGLSGGQKQRLGIARALYKNPELIIFDEATSSLDNETENEIMKSINSLHGKKTIIIIAHRLTTIANCDKVYIVKDGKISTR